MERNEAMEIVKKLYNDSLFLKKDKEAMVTLIPELAESEDEKIRKAVIDAVETLSDSPLKVKMLAWLEKQGEQKEYPQSVIDNAISFLSLRNDGMPIKEAKDIVNAIITVLNPSYWPKQGEQKPADKVEPKFKVGQTIKKEGFNLGFTIVKIKDSFYYNDMGDYFPFTDQDKWELVEQKPWSEEDEAIYYGVIETEQYMLDVVNGKKKFDVSNASIKEDCTRELDWLKSLKDRVQPQPKQEWSEEDNRKIDELIALCKGRKKLCSPTVPAYKRMDELKEWLKSLRPQST